MIPKRPFIFTKMDSPAKPMTGSKQYPNQKSSSILQKKERGREREKWDGEWEGERENEKDERDGWKKRER